MQTREIFAKVLRKLRGEKTQQQISDAIGVSKSSYVRWEHALAFPQPNEVLALANLFDVSVDYLYGREEPRHIETQGNSTLTEQEKDLLTLWGSLSEGEKLDVLFIISRLSSKNLSSARKQGEGIVLEFNRRRTDSDNATHGEDG